MAPGAVPGTACLARLIRIFILGNFLPVMGVFKEFYFVVKVIFL